MKKMMEKILPSLSMMAAGMNQVTEGTSVTPSVPGRGSLPTIVATTRTTSFQSDSLPVPVNAEVHSASVSEEEILIFNLFCCDLFCLIKKKEKRNQEDENAAPTKNSVHLYAKPVLC